MVAMSEIGGAADAVRFGGAETGGQANSPDRNAARRRWLPWMFGATVERFAVSCQRSEQKLDYIARRLRSIEDRLDLLDSGESSQVRRAALDKVAEIGPLLFQADEMFEDESKAIGAQINRCVAEIESRWRAEQRNGEPLTPLEQVQAELSAALRRIEAMEASRDGAWRGSRSRGGR